MVRKAKACDAERIFEIRKECNEETELTIVQNEILSNNYIVMVAENESESVVSFLSAMVSVDACDIIMVATKKDYRKKGFAQGLFDELKKELKNKNISQIFLEVRQNNGNAIALYKKLGFVEIGRRKKYYQNTFDALVMKLSL